jgi:endonuclease-3
MVVRPQPGRDESGSGDGASKVARVAALLDEVYGPRRNQPSGDPLDGLVGTILSQHTSDVNSHRAHRSLRERFPTWQAVLDAPEEEVAEAIRSGGLARLKARRIKEVLALVAEERGGFDLGFLADLPLDEARAWLRALPGVGPKTAACVLMFDLDRPALPVDTHVHRVARRLGLIGPRVSAEAAHAILEAELPAAQVFSFHMNMIAHGRRICRAPIPKCGLCPLTHLCDYYQGQHQA